MPDTPNNRPAGRQRTGGGQASSVSTHGSGLGTGPVGKTDGYSARRGQSGGSGGSGSSGGGQRASIGGGKGKLLLIVAVIAMLVIFGGKGISNMFGGTDTEPVTAAPTTQSSTGNNGGSGIGSLLSSLGSFSGNSSYSTGWTGTNNTGKLNTGVNSAARAKRTALKGNSEDTVTFMVYLCGTDLESKSGMASNDLAEMARATLSDKVNIIVFTGGCKQWKTSGISNSVNQIYKVESGSLRLLEKNMGNSSMTAPANLTSFINYCKQNYPASRNELILWDHGGGTVSGFGYDEKNAASGSMTLVNIAKAIKDTGMTFDFIGFDACLMATLETALVLEPYADYLIASEETEPGIGWYYTNWLTSLSKNTSLPTTELGKMIADDFVNTCAQKCPGQKATLSVIDLGELAATVGDKLSDFAGATAAQISGSGYSAVSEARANTREFATSSKIDQIDLVHLALNLGTDESKALADTLLSAVKYNKTSSSITNAYGISAYFPYRSTAKVGNAVKQLDAIGFDSDYTACVKKFASLEVTGQAAGGGSTSPFGSLFGSLTGGSSGGSAGVSDLIGSLLGGGTTSGGLDLTALLGGSGIFDRSVPEEELVSLVESNMIDNDALVWVKDGDNMVLKLSEDQWSLVENLLLNVFLDDGEGYIDLGLDNIFYWTDAGDLIGEYDNMWVGLNGQTVAYYFMDAVEEDGERVTTGYIPVLLNGDRAELIVVFNGNGAEVTGARFVYNNGETETVAKADVELKEDDVIQPVCDRYTYDGEYEDSYKLGGEITVGEGLVVADLTLDPGSGKPVASYVLTDRFHTEHWTPAF